MHKLDAGDTFPAIELDLVGGGKLALPGGVSTRYLVALFYRGHW